MTPRLEPPVFEDGPRAADGSACEFVDGELRERTMGMESTGIALAIGAEFRLWVKGRPIAWVFGSEGQYKCFAHAPERFRKPDVSVVLRERMPRRPRTMCLIAPDLVVEVVSPHDTAEEIIARLEDFRLAGTKLVLVAYPEQRRIFAHSPNATKEFGPNDLLDVEPVLPGFSVRVAELFE